MKKPLLSQNRTDLAEGGTACPSHFIYPMVREQKHIASPESVRMIGRKRREKISREHEA